MTPYDQYEPLPVTDLHREARAVLWTITLMAVAFGSLAWWLLSGVSERKAGPVKWDSGVMEWVDEGEPK